MCGRVKLDKTLEEIIKHFNLVMEKPELYAPASNIAPGQIVPVITCGEPDKLQLFKWGLIPSWSRDVKSGYKMFNARAETLTEKPAYKNLIKNNRCAVITNGFYEWKETDGGKLPYLFKSGGKHTVLAGLWDFNPKLNISTFTVITCGANSVIAGYHNRMPVILNEEEQRRWLSAISEEEALAMLKPYKDKIDIEETQPLTKRREDTLDLFRK